jgi:hypothetical protein
MDANTFLHLTVILGSETAYSTPVNKELRIMLVEQMEMNVVFTVSLLLNISSCTKVIATTIIQ